MSNAESKVPRLADATPYRTIAEMIEDCPSPNGKPRFRVFNFQRDPLPDCPKCARGHSGRPKICLGKRTFFGNTPTCPQTVTHFHPRCDACGFEWLMATKDGEGGMFE